MSSVTLPLIASAAEQASIPIVSVDGACNREIRFRSANLNLRLAHAPARQSVRPAPVRTRQYGQVKNDMGGAPG
jgi:hypothetical protein